MLLTLRLSFNQLCKRSYKDGMIATVYHSESYPAVFIHVVMLMYKNQMLVSLFIFFF